VEFVTFVFVLNTNVIFLNQFSTKTAIKNTKMTTQQFKQSQIISGSIMILSLITYLYMDWKLGYKGSYYFLTKAIFQLSLASISHFSMINLKANHPEKYNPTLHKILVCIWGIMGVLQIIDFFSLLF
jgi:hypothetical protein